MAEESGYFDTDTEKINLNYLLTNKLEKIDTLPQAERISTLKSLIITTSGLTDIGLPELPTMEEVKEEWNARTGSTVKIHLRESRAAKSGEFISVRKDLYENKLWEVGLKVVGKLYEQGYIGFDTLAAMEKFQPDGI